MNPFVLMGAGLLGLLAIFLYVMEDTRQADDMYVQHAQHQVQVAKFDQDFASVMNSGGPVQAPSAAEVKAKADAVAGIEAERARAQAETKRRMEAMRASLDQMSGYANSGKQQHR